ncbi:MFS transporter [Bacillus sp. USDA818B3_A]|uniref:MFS transporter n=1 Tax=Bacillus sp. USDA818B3_A TaxID=2698834 RepID=UPI001923EF14|nr:MFS transporter [Bacillus sp. USDA818B3_A]
MTIKNSGEKLWRVIMTPLGSASSNVHFFLFISFFMVFATEALKMNPVITGIILTVSRLFNAFIDPIVGTFIDKTETKFGKFRPFLVSGSIIMNISLIMLFQMSFIIPENFQIFWIIFFYGLWDIGYSMMSTVNKSVLAVITRNPKQRPVSGIAGGVYSTLLSMAFLVSVVPVINMNGGFGTESGWKWVSTFAVILNLVLLGLALFAISAKDKPEIFRIGDQRKEKVKVIDYWNIIKSNKPLQMLMISASSNKLADTVDSAALIYFYMYAVQNVSLQPMVSGYSTIVAFVGAFFAGGIAIRFGLRKAFVLGAWINLIFSVSLLLFRPFDVVPVFILLMSLNTLCRRLTAQNVDPMIADVVDYHTYKTGKFIPGMVASSFSFIDKVISSFAGSIVGLLMGLAGYHANAQPTTELFWTSLLIYLGFPILGDIISIIAMKFYNIDKTMYKQIYASDENCGNSLELEVN